MKVAALIPARFGSKRLPRKNIRKLGGKPLLFWSIEVALASNCFTKICVSSESDEVLNMVRANYSSKDVETIKRPDELATDHADLNDVCKHFLEQNQDIEMLSLMMPTYPFRKADRIRCEILPPLLSRQVDRVISVLPDSYSTFDYWIRNGKNFQRMFKHAPLWCGGGTAVYHFQIRKYYYLSQQQWPYLLGERTLRIQADINEFLDIDTPEDFEKAEKLCEGYRLQKKAVRAYQDDAHEIITPEDVNPMDFKKFVTEQLVNPELPVLLLKPAFPIFTFLRWYECNSSRNYNTSLTEKIIAKLPMSGHSQDFPQHCIHSSSYRILRLEKDREGIQEEIVPQEQVIFEDKLRKWEDYVEPYCWIKSNSVIDL